MQYENVPFTLDYDYRLIKLVRQIRDLTLADMQEVSGINLNTLALLEKDLLPFTPLYQSKFHHALKELKISNVELASMKLLMELKAQQGIN